MSADDFLEALTFLNNESDNQKFFNGDKKENLILNIRMSDIFSTAKHFQHMPLYEVSRLLDSKYYEARMGAVSIMDFQARDKKTSPETKKALFDLYIEKHDRINNWDLVDRSAPFVVGGYLVDKDRRILYKLAKSKVLCERRTAIVATYYFIRQNDIDDTFNIAELLVHDTEDLINKAVGSWIREAGKRDKERLLAFLDKYGATMPRVTLRYAIEKLAATEKDHYMKLASKK